MKICNVLHNSLFICERILPISFTLPLVFKSSVINVKRVTESQHEPTTKMTLIFFKADLYAVFFQLNSSEDFAVALTVSEI